MVNPVLFQVLFLVLPKDSIQVIYQVLCQVLFQVLTQANLLVSSLISSNIGLSICSFSSIQCFSPFFNATVTDVNALANIVQEGTFSNREGFIILVTLLCILTFEATFSTSLGPNID